MNDSSAKSTSPAKPAKTGAAPQDALTIEAVGIDDDCTGRRWTAAARAAQVSDARRPVEGALLMTTLSPGCLCICRQCGTQPFVVVDQSERHRWRLRGKCVDARVTCLVASGRDLDLNLPGTHLLTRHHDQH
jgi:hypothetical protein